HPRSDLMEAMDRSSTINQTEDEAMTPMVALILADLRIYLENFSDRAGVSKAADNPVRPHCNRHVCIYRSVNTVLHCKY
ncbi:MAG: hypothetical protein PHP79_02115, partial [Clostridia bacterium]|nr:hypothetical protein [Clostridia bacterium]